MLVSALVQDSLKIIAPFSTNQINLGETDSKSNSLSDANVEALLTSLKLVFHFGVDNKVAAEDDLPKSITKPGSLFALIALQSVFLESWDQIKFFWKIFVQKIREHWDSHTLLPHVQGTDEKFTPNWKSAIIEQQLCMVCNLYIRSYSS